jgi:hypothetical protein
MPHDVRDEYRWFLDCCKRHSVPEYMLQQSLFGDQDLWRIYERLLSVIPFSLGEKGVVDFGCKYGGLLPVLRG